MKYMGMVVDEDIINNSSSTEKIVIFSDLVINESRRYESKLRKSLSDNNQ